MLLLLLRHAIDHFSPTHHTFSLESKNFHEDSQSDDEYALHLQGFKSPIFYYYLHEGELM